MVMKMNIEFSKEQFRNLLDLVYAGNWVINANRETELIKKYDTLESYIFSKCDEFGFKELAEKDEDESYPSGEFDESGIMDYVEDYNEDTVLQELAEQLSYRDAPKVLSEDGLADYLDERYDIYMKEFDENGLENVTVNLDKKDSREVKL